MPKLSIKEMEKVIARKLEAQKLYKEGYSMRAIGKKLGRSQTWVWLVVKAIKELNKENVV